MTDINLHRFGSDAQLVLVGPITLADAVKELKNAVLNSSRSFESGDDAMAHTSFTLSRSSKDFIQVNCDGVNEVWFLSDRLVSPASIIKKIFNSKNSMAFGGSLDLAEKVIERYFALPRNQFEAEYSQGYQSSRAIGYVQLDRDVT